MGILPLLYRIKEREQGAPRITEDRKRLEAEFGDDRSEVLDMGAPRYRIARVRLRPTASPLIVKEQVVPLAEVKHLREHVTVIGSRPSVQNDQLRRIGATVHRPVQWRSGGRRESFLARSGDGLGHRVGPGD